MNSNKFVCMLSQEEQNEIEEKLRKHLESEGYSKDEIEETIKNAMDDRLWNLEEIMDITKYM